MESEARLDSPALADSKLLDKIDQLFELNVGELVALPQVLVVGDQSSGKSSVLEGLFDLPFPRDSGLCTRFATQITFRRNPTTSVTVTIIPGPDASPSHADELRAWRGDLSSLDRDTFGDIVRQAYGLMGLGDDQKANKMIKKTFSDDVLKIEILGPKQEHLSVIDVPGIFRQTTAGVTTKADIEMVRAMILSYMKNERSIMLAVIPANVDIATQEILELAGECDPSGRRTLGVLTKPDLVDKGAEPSIIKIIEGKTHPLKLGWCIVRNAGQQDLTKSSQDRQLVEQVFFKTQEPWTKLPKDRVGIASLRSLLVTVLGSLVTQEFSKVKVDISATLRVKREQLRGLGPSRASTREQYDYLLNLAVRFQQLTEYALEADYGKDDVFDNNPNLKIATTVMNRNALFSEDMAKRGHVRAFKKETAIAEELASSSEILYGPKVGEKRKAPTFGQAKWEIQPEPASLPIGATIFSTSGHTSESPLSVDTSVQSDDAVPNGKSSRRHQGSHAELEDILAESITIAEPSSKAIIPWLTSIYQGSRGFELGTFDTSMLPIIWKKQSQNWNPLTLGYVSDIVEIIHTFTIELLKEVCTDERVFGALFNVLLDGLLEQYIRALDHARFLLEVEREVPPQTTNHYFAENLEKNRQTRVKNLLLKNSFINADNERVVKVDTTIATTMASNFEHTIADLHDILHSYYKVARKRFVDTVCMQAADYHLIHGKSSPIKLLSPVFVSSLSDAQLETIAGEDVITRRQRDQLTREIEKLEKGMRVLR